MLSELADLAPPTYFRERSARCSDISVTIPRCYKDVHVNSFFLAQQDSQIIYL